MSLPARTMARVVVAVDQGGGDDFVLELARQIVPTGALEMLGLFVENARLLEHAQSRLAREVMLSGRERRLEPQGLERQLRAEAARARAQFESAANRIGVAHGFQIARGDIAVELLRRATEAQALIVSLAEEASRVGYGLGAALREVLAAPLPLLLIARRGWLLGESIAVVVGNDAEDDATLAAAARIARLSHSPIVALAAAANVKARAHAAERVAAALAGSGVTHVETVMLSEPTPSSIVTAARAWRARLVVLPAPSTDLAVELIARLSSALLLVGPGKR